MRPGVPTTICAPSRKAANWGPYQDWFLAESQALVAIRLTDVAPDGTFKHVPAFTTTGFHFATRFVALRRK